MKQTLALTLLLGMATMLGIGPASAQAPQPVASQQSFAPNGERTCLTCHGADAKVTPILKTPHAVKGDAHTPFAHGGCEACHGPGGDHAAMKAPRPSIVYKGPNTSSVAERNAQCLSCHQAGLRMNWQGSQMERAGLACNDCHTIHVAKDPVLVKATQPAKCFTCHAEQRADSFRYSHHPIREGKVVCSDCHNPHGSPGPKLLKEFTVNETCYNCHAEKRGPLLWEHAPVRESCLNCHTPHGSDQARLLIERPPYLCQACHANSSHQSIPLSGSTLPGQIAANVRLMARGCVNCHSQIHGSNSPNGTFFTR